MSKTEEQQLAHWLRQLSASQLRDWLERVRLEPELAPSYYNWWVWLAERAEFNARKNLDLSWAEIAVSIYEDLDRRADAGISNSAVQTSLELRLVFMTRLGSKAGDPILDPMELERVFFDHLKLSYEQALGAVHKEKSSDAPADQIGSNTTATDDDLRLLDTRDQLCVIQSAVDRGILVPSSELVSWLQLATSLP
jgi:hypothetical protein